MLALAGTAGWFAFCGRSTTRPVTNQVVVLGFDGADPTLLSKWIAEGRLPNLAHLAQTGTFETLGTTNPPESPVAWASFATGLNPGGTGIFDFLKRDPRTYLPELGLVERKKPRFLFGLIPIRSTRVTNERHGVPFYQAAADAGYKTTVIRMPLEFPPSKIPGGKLWSGLDVPDVRGTWGTFFYFGTDITTWEEGDTEFGGRLMGLQLTDNEASSTIDGPVNPAANSYQRVKVPIHFKISPDGSAVTIQLNKHAETVEAQHWSQWFHVQFKITPFLSVSAICRFYVLEVSPDLRVYMCPLNIDPEDPVLPVSYPAGWTKQLVKKYGLFKTIGWWHDTWALNEERIGEGVFLQDLFRTMSLETRIVLNQLKSDPPSLMVAVFTSTDSVSHMFWRLIDPKSPRYDPVLASKYGDAILRVYERMDQVVGQVEQAMKPGGTLIIVSDHGFHSWRKGFNTNTWLVQNGHMVLKNSNAKEKAYKLDELYGQGSFFPNVDWTQTKAYALGLGQIYLNLKGREKDGIVEPGEPAERLLREIRAKLLAYRDPDTQKPVLEDVYLGQSIDHGPYMADAPDLQLNFYPGYRTSWQTALGAIPPGIVVANMKKWSGDHCASDPKDTGGILLINRKLATSSPSIMDVAPTVLGLLNVSPPDKFDGRPWTLIEDHKSAGGSKQQ
ncbi:MAG TPA: alkaline phosphatase family protein [Terriglobia bacterium]|nr:alkaline phosphatase family protein [Terriglobia bacterium]